MLTLSVDTSTRSGSVAALKDDQVLSKVVISSERPYGEQFQTTVDGLLGRSNIGLSQLDLFGVAVGPGSFTGVRVGLAAVKAWAEVFRKPVAAVSVLEAIAAQANPPSTAERLIVAVLDARRGQVFGGI